MPWYNPLSWFRSAKGAPAVTETATQAFDRLSAEQHARDQAIMQATILHELGRHNRFLAEELQRHLDASPVEPPAPPDPKPEAKEAKEAKPAGKPVSIYGPYGGFPPYPARDRSPSDKS